MGLSSNGNSSSSSNRNSSSSSSNTNESLFLSFGSSVNVCEEQRKAIRQEVEEIDSVIDDLRSNCASETQTKNHVMKDIAYSKKEMYHLRRAGKEQLETSNANDMFSNRLAESFGAKLKQTFLQDDEGEDSPNGLIEIYSNKITSLEGQVDGHREKGATFEESLMAIQENVSGINKRIESEKLKKTLDAEAEKAERKMKESAYEESRCSSLELKIQASRNECGTNAQRIADDSEWLSNNRAMFAKEEGEIEKILAAEKYELAVLKGTEEEALRRLTIATEDVKKSRKQIAQYELFNHDLKTKNETARESRAEVEKLLLLSKEYANKFEEEKCELADCKAQLVAIKLFQSSVDAQKAENETIEKDKMIPGKLEKQVLAKDKEELGGRTNAIAVEKEDVEKHLKENLSVVQASLEESVSMEMSIATLIMEKQTMLDNYRRRRTESREATEKQISELAQNAQKYSEGTKAEESRTKEREEEKAKKLHIREEARKAGSQRRRVLERQVEILQTGQKEVDEARKEEEDVEKLISSVVE